MAAGLRIIPEPIRARDTSSFTGSLQTLGSGLTYACCLIKIINTGNISCNISWDGVNTHDVVPANSFALYDVCSDAGSQRGLYVAQGTQFWVSGVASGTNTGTVYLVAFHTSEF